MPKAKKVLVIGMDGMMFPMWKRFCDEGITPNLKRMGDEGVATESYCALPTWTPTNWATLMTGANTGTHTVSRWFLNSPSPRDTQSTLSAFMGNAVKAETIFEATSRAGLKSVAVHYPASGPARTELEHKVDGFGHPGFGTSPFEITPAHGYTTVDGIRNSYKLDVQPAASWANSLANGSGSLEFPFPIITKKEGENQAFVGLAVDSDGNGFDTVALFSERDASTELGRAKVGEWSDWITYDFTLTDEGTVPAVFRFKTLEVSPDGSKLRLYRSQVTYASGFTEPPELADELTSKFGPYPEHASHMPYTWGLSDLQTAFDEIEYQCEWFGDVANYLLHEKDFSLFYTHIHLFDYFNHHFIADVDPEGPGYDPDKAKVGWLAYREAYKVCDRLFAKLLDAADEDTAILIVSDHAVYPQIRATDVFKLLQDNGLLVFKEGFTKRFNPNEDFDEVDMDRTKIFLTPLRSFELFVNAPEGSPEYKQIQRETVTLLRSWVDKERGQSPVAVAMPKVHASLLGFWGEQCGDVVFVMEDGYVGGYPSSEAESSADPYVWAPASYGGHHGPYLPTARTEISSNMAIFIGRGPGLKQGYVRPVDELGFMHQRDVVSIVSHLLGIDPPAQAQGQVPRDFLEHVEPVYERRSELPAWEKGTDAKGFGDRVWTQGGDMVAGFFAGEQVSKSS